MASKLYPMWPPGVVEAVCKVLASTDWPGLSGSEISRLLRIRYGPVQLPKELAAGHWRLLDPALHAQLTLAGSKATRMGGGSNA